MRLKRKKTNLVICSIIMIILGGFYLHYVWKNSIRQTGNWACEMAVTAKNGFRTELFGQLEAAQEDMTQPGYQQIKDSLNRMTGMNTSFFYVYFYTVKEGRICILADSLPAGSEYDSSLTDLYAGNDEPFLRALQKGETIYTGPLKGRWGKKISVLTPLTETDTGRIIAVFGMDYSVGTWYRYAIHRTIENFLALLLLISFFVMAHLICIKHYALKRTNTKLVRQEEIFHAIFEQAPYGIAFGNRNTDIVDSNHMFENIVGRTGEELKQLNWTEITHPEDIEKEMEHFKSFKRGEISGYSLEKRYVRPEGSFIWTNTTLAEIQLENKDILSHICITEDITERIRTEKSLRESERSLAMLLSNLPGMAYRCNYDRDWTMQFVSEGCYELTGYHPESLIHSRDLTFNDLISAEYREILWEKWTEVLRKRGIFREEYKITTADKKVKWVFEQGQFVFNDKGEAIAIEGLIIDISKQRKREEEILYLTYHDVLTGLYNRRYYEEAKIQIDDKDNYPLSVIVGDINGLKLINSAIGHHEGDRLIRKVTEIMKSCCRPDDILARTGGDEFSILLPRTTYEEADRIVNRIGELCEENRENTPDEAYHVSISVGCATKKDESIPLMNIIKSAEESMYRHKLLQSHSLHSSLISTMKTSLFEKSQETEAHAQRLITLSRAIGERLNLTKEQLNELELLSTLHDIGKIGISDTILNKPGNLTKEEWLEMKKHPEMGYRIAMSTPELAPIAEYILNHHERWDGAGYPYGRKGEEIPLLSRIISIADSFDAMTSDRPYRKAMTMEEAKAEIRRNSGTQFDPGLSELFLTQVLKDLDKHSEII